MPDFIFILQWWFVIFAIGIIFFPIASILFKNFYDCGYLFSKVLGIAVISYSAFLLGIAKIAPFTNYTLYLLIVIFLIINGLLFYCKKQKVGKPLLKIAIFEELLFLLALSFWVWIKAHQPEIYGLEKYMDFGFINSILRSTYFPPVDMWYPPNPINYYYFGHFVTATLTKITNIIPNISYNLMLCTIFAFCISLPFSLVLNFLKENTANKLLKSALVGALLAAGLSTLAGNLHTIYSLFTTYNTDNPVPFWNLPFSFTTWPNGYWYPNATRFIPFTIHEFPIYSFVVSDLHGHVLDIPLVLFSIAFAYSMFQDSKIRKYKLVIASFFLSVMYMTNAWDGFIYFLLLTFCILVINVISNSTNFQKQNKALHNKNNHRQENHSFNIKLFFFDTIEAVLILFLGFFIFSFPFNANFSPFVSGIGVICAPAFLTKIQKLGPFLFEPNHCARSTWWEIATLYGFFFFYVGWFMYFVAKHKNKINKQDLFIVLLILLSMILIIIPEFIYIKDIYPAHYRANTMFKLVYQAFIMLSISCAYIFIRILKETRNKIFLGISYFLMILVFSYPYFAVTSYFNSLNTNFGIDGIRYLERIHPSDYQAILWINKNIHGQPVMLEAQGDSYTDYERISANTGLPTIIGWAVHEWLWRGTYDLVSPRINEVKDIYESQNINLTKNILAKYDVSYIYIGDLEKQKYPLINEAKFQQIGKIIYQNNKVKIYKIQL